MGGFDMGVSFDGFEENMKKFMELPVKYLDSAHDKAVEFMEDVHAILYAPFTNNELPEKEDKSSSHVIAESSPTSVGTEVVGPNVEASTPPASLITVENSSNGCVDNDTHETESFSSKSTDSSEEVILWNPETSIKPQRPHELATIPQDDHEPHALETEKATEQVGLHCSGHSDSSVYCGVLPPGNSSADYEEQILSHANDPIGVTVQDSTAISQDDYVPQAMPKEQVTEQVGLNCSGHSDSLVSSTDFFDALLLELEDSSANSEEQMISYSANIPVEATTNGTCISHNSGTDESSCVDDPSTLTDITVKFVDIDLKDGQEHMANDKIEVFAVPERRNPSFKKMIMTNLSRKLRWSKRKHANAHEPMPSGSQDAENLGYQLVSFSSSDGWEVV
ncbi:hypothetical protein BS78_03G017800 [Paspalum vaginatum]|nr:hypothetical protein BS78_03G017800 [Paspalum vaginatum]